jgi:hypothetical protein
VPVVAAADAVVDPGAVVIAHGDADAAEATVFGARGFLEMAGRADVVGLEESVVEGVVFDPGLVGRGRNVVRSVGGAEVCEEEGLDYEEGDGQD